jgi:hypothetical protein
MANRSAEYEAKRKLQAAEESTIMRRFLSQVASVLRADSSQKWQSNLPIETAALLHQSVDHVFREIKNAEDELDRSSIKRVIVFGPLVGADASAFRGVGERRVFSREGGLGQSCSHQMLFKKARRKNDASPSGPVDAVLTHVTPLASRPFFKNQPQEAVCRSSSSSLHRGIIAYKGLRLENVKDGCGWKLSRGRDAENISPSTPASMVWTTPRKLRCRAVDTTRAEVTIDGMKKGTGAEELPANVFAQAAGEVTRARSFARDFKVSGRNGKEKWPHR